VWARPAECRPGVQFERATVHRGGAGNQAALSERELAVARLDESLGTTAEEAVDGQITHVVEDQLRVRAGRDDAALDAAVAGQGEDTTARDREGFEGASGVVE